MERDWQERKRHFSNSHKFKKKNSLILDKIFKIEKIGKIGNYCQFKHRKVRICIELFVKSLTQS